jgi:hypothetical protein
VATLAPRALPFLRFQQEEEEFTGNWCRMPKRPNSLSDEGQVYERLPRVDGGNRRARVCHAGAAGTAYPGDTRWDVRTAKMIHAVAMDLFILTMPMLLALTPMC